jgi:hypothetical protein
MKSTKHKIKENRKYGYEAGLKDGWAEGYFCKLYPNAVIKKLFWNIWYVRPKI